MENQTMDTSLTEDLERKIKKLMTENGREHLLKPDGKIKKKFIISCLIENNPQASEEFQKIKTAFNKLKQNGALMPKVRDETLRNIQLYEYLVMPMPIKSKKSSQNEDTNIGIIIKLPERKTANDFSDGEGWKAALKNEEQFKVGDKVIYSWSSQVIRLDGELLHIVCSFSGKILE